MFSWKWNILMSWKWNREREIYCCVFKSDPFWNMMYGCKNSLGWIKQLYRWTTHEMIIVRHVSSWQTLLSHDASNRNIQIFGLKWKEIQLIFTEKCILWVLAAGAAMKRDERKENSEIYDRMIWVEKLCKKCKKSKNENSKIYEVHMSRKCVYKM